MDSTVTLTDDADDQSLLAFGQNVDFELLIDHLDKIQANESFLMNLLKLIESLCFNNKGQLVETLMKQLELRDAHNVFNSYNDDLRLEAIMVYLKYHTILGFEEMDRYFSILMFENRQKLEADLISLIKWENKRYPEYSKRILLLIDRFQLNQQVMFKAMMIAFLKNENPFVVICCDQISYDVNTFRLFLKTVDSYMLNRRLMIAFIEQNELILRKMKTQPDIKKFFNKYYKSIQEPRVDYDCTPHYIETFNWECLAYLLKLRYRQKSMSSDAFIELSLELVKESPAITKRLLSCLEKISSKEHDGWLKAQKNYETNLPPLFPNDGQYIINPKLNSPTYSPRNSLLVIIVDTVQKFESMLVELQKSYVIGLDAEWLPVLSYKNIPISILQVSTAQRCFIVDLLKVASHDQIGEQYVQHWQRFVDQVLHNPSIVKLGFNSGHDISKLKWTTTRNTIKLQNEIDFRKYPLVDYFSMLNAKEQSNQRVKMIISRCQEEQTTQQGLSRLTYLFFGRPLDKMEQQSNWNRRPLRIEQLTYAAFDAHCLVDIYMLLTQIYRSLQFDSLEHLLSYVKSNF